MIGVWGQAVSPEITEARRNQLPGPENQDETTNHSQMWIQACLDHISVEIPFGHQGRGHLPQTTTFPGAKEVTCLVIVYPPLVEMSRVGETRGGSSHPVTMIISDPNIGWLPCCFCWSYHCLFAWIMFHHFLGASKAQFSMVQRVGSQPGWSLYRLSLQPAQNIGWPGSMDWLKMVCSSQWIDWRENLQDGVSFSRGMCHHVSYKQRDPKEISKRSGFQPSRTARLYTGPEWVTNAKTARVEASTKNANVHAHLYKYVQIYIYMHISDYGFLIYQYLC